MTRRENKSKEMTKFLDEVSEDAFGKSRSNAIKHNDCVMCEHPDTDFRDTLSVEEYRISGMCQKCQDNFFAEDDRQRNL